LNVGGSLLSSWMRRMHPISGATKCRDRFRKA
jgi:hypothetical protein